MTHQRKRIWIDNFQTFLIVRIAVYCLLFQVSVWSLVLLNGRVASALEGAMGPDAASYAYAIPIIGGIVISLGFMYDGLKFAHRLVGPIYRFRKTLQAITAGEQMQLIRLRDGDFLVEMRDDVNDMLKALEQRGAIVLKVVGKKEPVAAV